MRRLKRSRVIIGATSAAVVALGISGAGFAFVHNASAAVETYNSRGISVNPERQPAGSADDAVFGCQTDRGPGAIVCYSPQQMRTAYGVDKLIKAGLTGKGRTIVIVDAFQNPTMLDDLHTFDAKFGLPDPTFEQVAPDGLTAFDPTDPNMSGWAGEIALDVEWSHAIAPDAKIELVLAKSNQDADILSATKYAVDHNLGDVISQSFGENEACVDPKLLKAEHKVFADATKKGITLFASSGDQGAAQQTCDGNSWVQAASSPASDPLVTGVGGTELIAAFDCAGGCPAGSPAPGAYQSESVLNHPAGEFTEGNFSGGGGYSNVYKRPTFQSGVPNTDKGHRGVPDVAYDAGINHGVLGVDGGHFYVFGGTSAGSPQWAGLAALADQLAGRRLGFINASLYRIGSLNFAYTSLFHDVTQGDNTVQEPGAKGMVSVQGFTAATNWDAGSGLGSPKADLLVPTLVALNYAHDGDDAINSDR